MRARACGGRAAAARVKVQHMKQHIVNNVYGIAKSHQSIRGSESRSVREAAERADGRSYFVPVSSNSRMKCTSFSV